MTEITMPKLSDSMEEGTVLTWLKADGDLVEAGEDVVEIESDKATVTHAAEAAGVLRIVAPEGATLPVGATIATTGDATAEPPPVGATEPPPIATSGVELTVAAAAPVGPGDRNSARSRATPVARRIAAIHGVALDDIHGSGALGRITRADVLAKAGLAPGAPRRAPVPRTAGPAESASPPPPVRPAVPTGGSKGDVVVTEPSRLQSVVARRMAEAKATVPHFQVQTDVEMDPAIAFRNQLREPAIETPSVNDIIVKAAALALRAHPLANGAYRDGRFERYSRINVGIAVASDDALVVPTIFDADAKSLGAIAAESRRLAGRVRSGTVSPAELAGATFTVSNLGMYGMTAITPVINAPQAAILGVGAVRESLARVDGEVVDRHLLTLTLSCDHRILYGAQAAQFLSEIRETLERPARLAI